ncbi:MAG: FCD domain-containing protein [Pseudomonadota bacterium]
MSRRSRRSAGHDEIAAILGSEILSGARPPGSRMPSAAELFERFGVSRVLLREVTKTLTAKGMIASKTRVGTQVLSSEHWNWFDADVLAWRVRLGLDVTLLEQLADMRRAVEPAAAALAAAHRLPEHLAAMRAALAAMARAGTDQQPFADADLEFHVAVTLASGNPLFRSFAGVVETALAASLSLSSPTDASVAEANVARHAAIADAIEARDGAAAARAMLLVIDESMTRVTGAQSR